MRSNDPTGVSGGPAMAWLRSWRVIATVAAVLIGAGVAWFTAGEKQEIKPGVCIELASESKVTVVGCDDPDAELKVVYSAGVSTSISSPECEVGEPYGIVLSGENSSVRPVWCLVDADDDSAEVQDKIDEALE